MWLPSMSFNISGVKITARFQHKGWGHVFLRFQWTDWSHLKRSIVPVLLIHCSDLPILRYDFSHAIEQWSKIQLCSTYSCINVTMSITVLWTVLLKNNKTQTHLTVVIMYKRAFADFISHKTYISTILHCIEAFALKKQIHSQWPRSLSNFLGLTSTFT